MADTCSTTRLGANEPAHFRHSPVSCHFSHLLAALAAAIGAGRIGLALNQLDHDPARRLGHIARQIDEIIFLMRGESR